MRQMSWICKNNHNLLQSKKMMQPTTMMLEERHKNFEAELGHGAQCIVKDCIFIEAGAFLAQTKLEVDIRICVKGFLDLQ